MQELAKQFRHIMYTEAQLVTFGNFLFSRYDVKFHSTDGKNTPIETRQVTKEDICNWKVDSDIDDAIKTIGNLPSLLQVGDPAWLVLWSAKIIVKIICVHFYSGKYKYDVEVIGDNGELTRLYNVDSLFVKKSV